jgi:hypothetical protein
MSTRVSQSLDFEAAAADFIADFGCSGLVHGESVIVEGELVGVIVFVEMLDFVYDVFWRPHTVAATKHADSGTKVAPIHAASATQNGVGYGAVFADFPDFLP